MRFRLERKFLVYIFFVSYFLSPACAADLFVPEPVLKAKESLRGKLILSHIDFLASKFCQGRETGSKGMDLAIKYLTTYFQGIEASPAGEAGSYLQKVDLESVDLARESSLKITEKTGGSLINRLANVDCDFLPISLSAERMAQASLAFAGYGITAPEFKYDDYQGMNVQGKIVLVFRHEPRENDEKSPFEGKVNSTHGTLLTKILNAQRHGAVGIMIVNDPLNHENLGPETIRGTRWSSLLLEKTNDSDDFLFRDIEPDVIIAGKTWGVRIPAVAVSGALASDLLGAEHDLLKLQREIDQSLKPRSFNLPGKTADMVVRFIRKSVKAYNIAVVIQGSDPTLKDEYVLAGAHYDHVGVNKRGEVFGGADDNASGTAGILEIARAFQQLPEKPKRSLVFVLFTAEEEGLLGSQYYVEHPLFPLEKTVAMINLDMIGRNSSDQLSLLGRFQYPKLFSFLDKVNKETVNFDLNFAIEGDVRRSDQFPFMRQGVPSLFIHSGTTDEYHTPRDAAFLINPDKLTKVTQLVFLTLWRTADADPGTHFKD